MSIKSRKHPVVRAAANHADARTLGLMLAALPGLALGAQQDDRDPASGESVLPGVVVEGTVQGYKAERVTSPKFTQPLLDTPQTITVVTKELLEDQGAGSLVEALRNTPGITFTLGENGNTTAGDSVTMRGFDTSGSIFLDGVRDMGAISRDTFNVEQVEIVKGPAGTDNGRGNPTGYINQATKQPMTMDAASAALSYGTDNRMRFEGDLNHGLDAIDGAAVRLNVMYDRGDKPGRDIAEHQRWGIAPAFALGLGSGTRAYFNYLFVKQVNTPDGGIPTIGLVGYTTNNANPDIAAAVNAASPVDRDNFYGSLDDFEHVRGNMFTARIEHDLSGDTTLRNTSRYARYTMRRVITGINTLGNLSTGTGEDLVVNDPQEWTVSRSRQRRDEVNELLTNQSNLTTAFNTGSIGHSLSTGVEFIYERQLTRGATNTGTAQPANLYNPSTADSFVEPVPSGAANDGQTLTAAAYVFDTLRFNEQWSLTTGLRFDRFRTEYSIVPAPAPTPAASSRLEVQDSLFTGKLGLVYKPLPNGTIYAAIATSQQPPGGTNFTLAAEDAANANNPTLDPQKARNIEVGTKWDLLGNRLVVTAAAFDTRNKNDLAVLDEDTDEIVQYGERKVRGIELGASGMITRSWQLSAGIASMKTEITEGTRTGNPTTGAQLQYSPKLTFTSWTTYRFPFGLTVGGGARYVDSQFRNGTAAQATQANLAMNPDAWVFDLMAGYDVTPMVSVQLNAQNVTDKFYLASLNNGGSRFILGAPRTLLLTGRVRF